MYLIWSKYCSRENKKRVQKKISILVVAEETKQM